MKKNRSFDNHTNPVHAFIRRECAAYIFHLLYNG